MIVKARLIGKDGILSQRRYSYRCDIPVEIGTLVVAPTANGTAIGEIVEVNIPLVSIDLGVATKLKTITSLAQAEKDSSGQISIPEVENTPEPEALTRTEANIDNLIVVSQLPIIQEQLHKVKADVEKRTNEVCSLICTEESMPIVKRSRAVLNNEFKEFEQRRKDVKAMVEAPYKQFEAVYKECISDIYASADRQLKEKIDAVESGIKKEKTDAVKAYFDEYRTSLGIEPRVVGFEASGIRIGLNDSLKSLKAQASSFLDRISSDLTLIAREEQKDEILLEYCQNGLNLCSAVTTVSDRHRLVADARKRREEQESKLIAREEAAKKVEVTVAKEKAEENAKLVPPPAIVTTAQADAGDASPDSAKEKVYNTAFIVSGTLDQMKLLKSFLEENQYSYKTLKKNEGGTYE